MAKKTKNSDMAPIQPPKVGNRISVSIDPADNGSVVHISHDSKEGYRHKTLVAPNHNRAMRIATQHMRDFSLKAKGNKKTGKKKIAIAKSL